MPSIRTMADDLRGRDASIPARPPSPPVSRPTDSPRRPTGPGIKPAPGPAARPPALLRRPARPGTPVQPVGLPARAARGGGGRRLRLFLLGVGAVVILGGGVWAALRFLPRGGSSSLADAVPVEAVAFVRVQGEAAAGAETRQSLAQAFGLSDDRLAGATDVTYLLLPGGSPGTPVPGLLVRGMNTVDLSGAPSLGVQSVQDGLLVAESTQLGRVSALSGRAWSSDTSARTVLRGLPESAPIIAGFREPALATLLQPHVTVPLTFPGPLALAITPAGSGDVAGVVGKHLGSWASAGSGPSTAEQLPAGTVFAVERPVAVFQGLLQGGRNVPSTLAETIRALQEQRATVDELLSHVEGSVLVGVVPTSTPGVRDFAITIPLKAGADVTASLRALEGAATKLAPFFTGTPIPDAAFSEGAYRGVAVRYVNFGASNRAVDYAVARDQLLVATSRDSMFALIDTVLGVSRPLAAHPPFSRLSGAAQGTDWLFLRAHPGLREEVPAAYRIFHTVLSGLVLRPTGAGTLEGQAVLGSSALRASPASAVPPTGVPAASPPTSPATSPGLPFVPPDDD